MTPESPTFPADSLPLSYVGSPLGFSVFLLQNVGRKWKKGEKSEVAESCPTLCDPMDYSLPGSSVHGIFQARILEWVAISFSGRSSWLRDWTWACRSVGPRFTVWVTRKSRWRRSPGRKRRCLQKSQVYPEQCSDEDEFGHLVGCGFRWPSEGVNQAGSNPSYWKGRLVSGTQSIWRPSEGRVGDAQISPVRTWARALGYLSTNHFLMGWGTGNCRFRKNQAAGDLQGRERECG